MISTLLPEPPLKSTNIGSYTHRFSISAAQNVTETDILHHNITWNCGVEGVTDDPAIRDLRHRQARNFIAILMLSQGVPMMLAGDEILHTQGGNNNCYCQNNELSWLDWNLAKANRDHGTGEI